MSERAEEMSRAVADRQAHGDSLSDNSRTDTLRRLGSVGPELAGSATLSQQELVDRLCDDQVKRWRAGQRIPAESYLALHPCLQESGECAFELIYGETLLAMLGDAQLPLDASVVPFRAPASPPPMHHRPRTAAQT